MSSDSSSDDEYFFNILQNIPLPRMIRRRLDPFEMFNNKEFKLRYRLNKNTVTSLIRLFDPILKPSNLRNNPVTTSNQILLTLRYYATGSFQTVLGDHLNISQPSVCRIIERVTQLIANMCQDYIYMPRSPAEERRVKQDFFEIRQFPGIIGCIDCTHIRIQSPGGNNAERFRNRNGYFSINVQAVCDAQLRIMDIVARWPGSVHDSTIFNDSALRVQMEERQFGNAYLLGDGGYACKNYLLTPLLNPATPSQEAYNNAHIATRNIIERTFGVLKRRFPVLSNGMRLKVNKVVNIIVATAVLHNMAIGLDDDVPEINLHDGQNLMYEAVPVNNVAESGNARRLAIINTFFN